MLRADVTPADVKRFASSLKQFNSQLESNMAIIQRQFDNLGATWRDQEHKKFADVFQNTMRALERFRRAANEHVPFLIRKATKAEEYIGLR